ncbi:uncharacterized protein METZ01_LOCUS104222 [marine metagenome]|uniref:Uncharacterized protein n=1 Tax=marine metagenome TaxID=408172 RepID=A0A381WH15_9ZZZZ
MVGGLTAPGLFGAEEDAADCIEEVVGGPCPVGV